MPETNISNSYDLDTLLENPTCVGRHGVPATADYRHLMLLPKYPGHFSQ